ncbi:hypothetical protein HY604_04030 [Candidatus Peregrinibacteria bacterium]|nr:hypothetical protein [Candidatus Peregrinibacteria bacterium]
MAHEVPTYGDENLTSVGPVETGEIDGTPIQISEETKGCADFVIKGDGCVLRTPPPRNYRIRQGV